ncbi:hypothetical protein AB205_0189020 [Aquarana catesbeiana]|uniref:C2H2-type domain-containing protein n=1 Tax=Aquarana catesbeiana TaxID=8400 RepID=A0A2G9RDZ2_AQUCT|nr:hypothetical protein AB205_0189020 [Aquarana catesbeiana]
MWERPFSCLGCGISYTYKGNLVEHLRIHTGDLVIHQRVHMERPYSCSGCGKSFTYQGNLVEHLSIHMGEHLVTLQRRHTAQRTQCIQTAKKVCPYGSVFVSFILTNSLNKNLGKKKENVVWMVGAELPKNDVDGGRRAVRECSVDGGGDLSENVV